jgi:hypothetical protein
VSATQASQIANTIRDQIAVPTFMTLGASDLAYQSDPPGFTFKARIAPKGFSRPRVMRVTVTLNALDLYDIEVIWFRQKYGPVETHFEASNVYADQLNRILFSLDKEG